MLIYLSPRFLFSNFTIFTFYSLSFFTWTHTRVFFSDPYLSKLQTWCPLFLSTLAYISWKEGHSTEPWYTHQNQEINFDILYYHLIYTHSIQFLPVVLIMSFLCTITTKTCSLSCPESRTKSHDVFSYRVSLVSFDPKQYLNLFCWWHFSSI